MYIYFNESVWPIKIMNVIICRHPWKSSIYYKQPWTHSMPLRSFNFQPGLFGLLAVIGEEALIQAGPCPANCYRIPGRWGQSLGDGLAQCEVVILLAIAVPFYNH